MVLVFPTRFGLRYYGVRPVPGYLENTHGAHQFKCSNKIKFISPLLQSHFIVLAIGAFFFFFK
jgi:hypothetical protein